MGGKKYYCDYCKRTFKDAQNARQKHLTSIAHAKNYTEYYKPFKAPEEVLQEESSKIPCRRLATEGQCPFGATCRFSHYTRDQLEYLQYIVASKNADPVFYFPDKEWITKEYFEDTVAPEEIEIKDYNPWPLPNGLQDSANLPPSMRPMTYEDFKDCTFPEWGQYNKENESTTQAGQM
ncbi:unnamed protein product [Trichogramma brassicae]|uniref:C3H1-type domain-containing protein n=1 Tax=Trichogramma brassicae TaxID=86971 RepID=A0A6H5I6Y1_9HYME|nr:unnamed protein product [Trichogramma brassicae]